MAYRRRKKRTYRVVRRSRGNSISRWIRRHKGVCIGGILMLLLYAVGYYYFFMSSSGLRHNPFVDTDKCPEGYEIRGIDISHYQGKINWKELSKEQQKKYPLRFVIIKATEGSLKVDNTYAKNFKNAHENGFITGAYHFWNNNKSAQSQARHFINNVHLQKGDLPPVLDVETVPSNVDVEDFQSKILSWLTIVENAYGCKPILYTNHEFRKKYLSDPIFNSYPYWIAHYYVDEVKYKGKWVIWQYTDSGALPGIKGKVDLNVYNGSIVDLQNLCIK